MSDPARPLDPSTLTVTAGRPPRQPDGPLNGPITLASTYHAGGSVRYGRYGNPTWSAFEEALGALDGGSALAFASGSAATVAVLSLVPRGGVVVAPSRAYLGTLGLLAEGEKDGRYGDVRRVAIADTQEVVAACAGADLVWLDTPANPTLEVADVRAIVAAAHAAGALVVLDETFTTPLVQRGLEAGVDVVMHSATKYLSGHSDVLLGATVATDEALVARLLAHRSMHGAIPGPTDTWLALRGMRTLALRMERAQHSAGILAARLHEHAAVSRVRYPGLADDPGHAVAAEQMHGFGPVLSIEVAGGAAAADALCAGVGLWVHATSLGGVESSLERRRHWPGESSEVPVSLVRLSVGIEHVEDLWDDLALALSRLPPLSPSS